VIDWLALESFTFEESPSQEYDAIISDVLVIA
jgi:hypothetical protein